MQYLTFTHSSVAKKCNHVRVRLVTGPVGLIAIEVAMLVSGSDRENVLILKLVMNLTLVYAQKTRNGFLLAYLNFLETTLIG